MKKCIENDDTDMGILKKFVITFYRIHTKSQYQAKLVEFKYARNFSRNSLDSSQYYEFVMNHRRKDKRK